MSGDKKIKMPVNDIKIDTGSKNSREWVGWGVKPPFTISPSPLTKTDPTAA